MRRLFLSVALILSLVATSHALVVRLTPLADMLKESEFIVLASVSALDAKRPAMMLAVDKNLKGKPPFAKMPVLLGGDKRAVRQKESPQLLARLGDKLPLVIFVNKVDTEYNGLAYSNGTWFSLSGQVVGGEVRWAFAHLEPYMKRTYAGRTTDLAKIIEDGLAGKAAPPAPDAKTKEGIGPPVKEDKKSGRLTLPPDDELRGAASYAVVPTVFVAGPLAILAMMFPTVFGGWQRWLVLLTTVGTTSTLYTLHFFFGDLLIGTVWASQLTLWTGMTAVNLVGLGYAWARHLRRVQCHEAPLLASRVELLILGAVSLLALVIVVVARQYEQDLFSILWLPVTAFVGAFWLGTAYVAWTHLRGPRVVPAVGTETVILTCLVLTGIAGAPFFTARAAGRGLEGGDGAKTDDPTKARAEFVWSFRPPVKGALASTPVVVGERVLIAAAHDDVFRPFGAVYCLDYTTGKQLWSFSDAKKMKQAFSTPIVVGNTIYIGEGFHQDFDCKVYAIDLTSGMKIAEFETGSHTESSPVVVDSRVYFGAGDDGIYCVNAADLTKVWNFPAFHIDATPAVEGGRVYAGCGVGDVHKTTAVLCLDAKTGEHRWRYPTEHPVWGKPLVTGGNVFVGVGNGRLNEAAANPAGAIVCLDAKTGAETWKKVMPDGVLSRVTADRDRLYFGCRDGWVYALSRKDGAQAWRYDLGAPVVGDVLLDRAEGRLYAQSIAGLVTAVEAATGKTAWELNLEERAKTQVELISSPVVDSRIDVEGRERRRVFIAATLLSSSRVGELYCYEEKRGE